MEQKDATEGNYLKMEMRGTMTETNYFREEYITCKKSSGNFNFGVKQVVKNRSEILNHLEF